MWCATSAERYAADAVFTEIDTHALAQADALYELENPCPPLAIVLA